MSSRSSGTTAMRRTSTPSLRSSRARNVEFVSAVLPERISLPMTTMPAVRSIVATKRSDRDRVLAEIAAPELDVDERRLTRAERPLERGADLFGALHVLAVAAERFDHLVVAGVRELRRRGAVGAVELLLAAQDLAPPRVVADDADDVDLLPRHRLELHGVQAERAV